MSLARPTLLIFVHSWGGGAIRYARTLARYVSGSVDVVFAWGVDNRTMHISTSDPEQSQWSFALADGLEEPVRVLRSLHVARADLLCLVGFEDYIDEFVDRLAVPFDVTHLGYETLVHGHHQMGQDGLYIGDPAFAAKAAAVRRLRPLPRYLEQAERRIACSRDLAWRASRLMPGLPIVAARIPEPGNPDKIVPRPIPLADGEALRVLVLGRVARHKGLATICALTRIADAEDYPIEIDWLGGIQVPASEVPTFSRRLRILGEYADPELSEIVQRLRPHLAWLPFPIPETHSFALSDVMALGLPLLATGIGAIPERVEGRASTWLVPAEGATSKLFFGWFHRLRGDRLGTPSRFVPTSHLPPLAPDFYERDYLAPLLGDARPPLAGETNPSAAKSPLPRRADPADVSTLPFTGERFVPSERGEIAYEHYHRYAASGEAARGKVVLDVACGEGFGSAILARAATEVIGVDIDWRSVEHAAKTYDRPNVRFVQGDCRALPLPNASVDLIVSFETIEHIREHEAMLDEFVRVLRPDGTLIISTPDKINYDNTLDVPNAFHLRELTHGEFVGMLDARFPRVQVYWQRTAVGSFLLAEQPRGLHTLTGFMAGDRGSEPGWSAPRQPIFSVALCSRAAAAPSLFASSVHLDPGDDLLLNHHKVARWASALAEEREQLAHEVKSLGDTIDRANAGLGRLQGTVAENQATIASLEHTLSERNLELAGLRQRLAQDEAKSASLDRALVERADRIRALSDALAQSDARATELQSTVAAIRRSTSWRVTAPLRFVRRLLGRRPDGAG